MPLGNEVMKSQVSWLLLANAATATLPKDEYVSEANAHWETGLAAGYSEERSMHFHKGYQNNVTGSAGCQTFPFDGNDSFDHFMGKLEPLNSNDRFQYILKNM
jgi:hypothetical protein